VSCVPGFRHVFALVALAGSTLPLPAGAQSQTDTAPPHPVVIDPTATTMPSIDPLSEPADGTQRRTGTGITPLVAPIPFHNSQIGWGLVLMAGLIHRFDADTTIKPSTGAIAGMASENGSWGVFGIEVARFDHDAWRARGVGGYLDLRYDFYGIGIDAGHEGRTTPLDQQVTMAAGSLLRRVVTGLYLGAAVVWMQTTVTLRDSAGSSGPPATPDLATTDLFAPGLQAEFDTRNDDYWPEHGTLAQLKGSFFTTALGGARDFQRYVAAWSWYGSLRGKQLILATNVNACGAPGDAPFYGLCSIGAGRFALRGYTQGRYRDRYMTTVQAELRAHTTGRFGATIFGGFGQVASSAGDIFKAQALPAGGLGLRYKLTRNYPMHLRFDYAWGRDGGLLYFSVAEAF